MKAVYDKYKEKNFHYISINLDSPRSLSKVRSYVEAQNLSYEFWLDPNSEVFKLLNGQGKPYVLILTEQGKLVEKRVGFMAGEEKEIDKVISRILK